MAKVINNRIYIECGIGSIDSYIKEFEEVIKLSPDKRVTIWDKPCKKRITL